MVLRETFSLNFCEDNDEVIRFRNFIILSRDVILPMRLTGKRMVPLLPVQIRCLPNKLELLREILENQSHSDIRFKDALNLAKKLFYAETVLNEVPIANMLIDVALTRDDVNKAMQVLLEFINSSNKDLLITREMYERVLRTMMKQSKPKRATLNELLGKLLSVCPASDISWLCSKAKDEFHFEHNQQDNIHVSDDINPDFRPLNLETFLPENYFHKQIDAPLYTGKLLEAHTVSILHQRLIF